MDLNSSGTSCAAQLPGGNQKKELIKACAKICQVPPCFTKSGSLTSTVYTGSSLDIIGIYKHVYIYIYIHFVLANDLMVHEDVRHMLIRHGCNDFEDVT